MRKVYISLGSNMGDSVSTLMSAIQEIEKRIGSLYSSSSFYETEPWGFDAEQNFVNALICIESSMEAEVIMKELLQIENDMGRTRNNSSFYESRPIDLDIISVENDVIQTTELVVPHPKMHERLFVLIPFMEIEPNWRHPLINRTLQEMVSELDDEEKVSKLNL